MDESSFGISHLPDSVSSIDLKDQMNRFRKLEINDEAEHSSKVTENRSQPQDANLWMQRADEGRRLGQYEAALRFYSRSLEDDKNLVAAWVGQVQMLIVLGEHPEAELWSRKALELFPSDGELMASRAQALCRQGQTKPAFAAIDGAMNQPGVSAYRWVVRGELLLAGNQPTERHCFDKAMQLDADWLVATESALTYLYYKQPGNAQNRARLGVERGPDVPYAWYVVGLCQSQLGLSSQARRSFKTCLELAPTYREAEEQLKSLKSGGALWRRIRSLWGQ